MGKKLNSRRKQNTETLKTTQLKQVLPFQWISAVIGFPFILHLCRALKEYFDILGKKELLDYLFNTALILIL